MNILWNANPDLTKIEITDEVKNLFLVNYKYELLFNSFIEYSMLVEGQLKCDTEEKLQKKLKDVKKEAYESEELTLENDRVQWLLKSLNSTHMGDCTCVPCTCDRCYAESILGIDTIKEFSKHSFYKVQTAFGYYDVDKKEYVTRNQTIDGAIAYLENYEVSKTKTEAWKRYSQEEYEKRIARWQKEYKTAAKELRQYKDNHNL